jgi:protein-S-isoprenylcysteine O-methyltransferase Ste14
MTTIQLIWLMLGSTWTATEIGIAFKTRVLVTSNGQWEYRSERFIWLVVAIALMAALIIKQQHLLSLPIDVVNRQIIAIGLFIIGLFLRFYAVFALGQFFSTTVVTQDSHILIDSGPYQFIRHPAYTGLLCCFLAAGIAMGDILALLTLLCPITYVVMQRIQVEEDWLQDHFDHVYAEYCLRTKQLIPWIY